MKPDQVTQALWRLREDCTVDQYTLRKIEAVLEKLQGERVTIGRGGARQGRLEQVRALWLIGASPSAIAAAVGVSRTTLFRLLREVRSTDRSANG